MSRGDWGEMELSAFRLIWSEASSWRELLQYQTLLALSPTMRPGESEDPSEPYLPPPGPPSLLKGPGKKAVSKRALQPGW